MEHKIAKIVNDIHSTNDDLIELIHMLIDYYDLNDYIKTIDLENSKHLGCYKPNTKELEISLNHLLESSYKTCVSYSEQYAIRPDRMYIISILEAIYHEIYHAIQTKEADSSLNDTYHLIVKEGIELGRRSPNLLDKKEKMLFNFNYNKILIERSAEIFSIYSLLNYRNSRIFNIQELNYLRDYLNELVNHGYIFNQTPVKTYYKLRGKKHEYNMLDFNDQDYDMFTKFAWGFPVEKELIRIPDKYNIMNKR